MIRKRAAGILLHITSLPSSYGIGDLGPSAYHFADFLQDAGQRYWQILPLNPVDAGNGYSPYSSLSAFAGNPLMISPDILCHEGYIDQADLQNKYYFRDSEVDFTLAKSYKDYIFDAAFRNFMENAGPDKRSWYEKFCHENSRWLDDYALFVSLKNHLGEKSWKEWPEELRLREAPALDRSRIELQMSIEKEKFLQFIFFKQWYALKTYCAQRHIHFIGDLPFYVSYDSADVWSHPHIFKLDENRMPVSVSGVPPDYFSETGQLWGTPIFDWEYLRRHDYDWWIARLSHNLQMFDMLRLDHFRAFSAYWEVPAGEETAINGSWVKGPGSEFFRRLSREFPELPLIAEDLGTIDDDVRDLIAEFNLPGMKVLLFAFGPEMPKNPYILHNHVRNCVVYTGTHDNNTIKGWYLNETSPEDRRQISEYLQKEVDENNVASSLVAMALMSVAVLAIFPLQDLLGLGEEARMNVPSVAHGNWKWRFIPDQTSPELAKKLYNLMRLYGR